MDNERTPGALGSNAELGRLVERLLAYSDIRRNDQRENREALRDLLEDELHALVADARMVERERCARICDEARDAVWPHHAPEVLNAACTVCENLAKRIRGVEA